MSLRWLNTHVLIKVLMPALFLAASLRALTVEEAVGAALAHNRNIQVAGAEVKRTQRQYRAAFTQRLPQFNVLANGGVLLTRPGFSLSSGSLGQLANGESIPTSDVTVRAPRQLSAFVFGQANQPLTQQYRIGLLLKSAALATSIAQEGQRQSQQETINQVRKTYFAIVSAESQTLAAEENVRLMRELDRLVGERVALRTSLEAERLDVRSRLAQAEYEATVPRNQAADAKEQLNILMGRPVDAVVEVSELEDLPLSVPDSEAARKSALGNRPERRQAALQIQQAAVIRRAKLAEYIPDVSLNFSYLSFVNMGSQLPSNIASAGLQLQWEPFDWGRKRQEAAGFREQETQARLRQAETAAQVSAQAGSAWRRLQEARQLLAVCRLRQSSSREAVRETKIQYEQKAALLSTVLDRQTAKVNADDQLRRTLAQFWTARADLDRAVGSEEGSEQGSQNQ